jgi:hypothetical protein
VCHEKTSIRIADMSGLRFEPGTYGADYWTATLRENVMIRHMSGLLMCALEGRAGMVEMFQLITHCGSNR